MLNDLLGNLMGNKQQRDDYGDFARRYDQGHPSEGYDDREVYDRYNQVTRNMPDDMYVDSAEEAFRRMSPQERQEFGRHMQQRARQQNVSIPDFNQDGIDDRMQDPRAMAEMTGRMRQQQSGGLGGLLGGGGMGGGGGQGSLFENPLARAAMAGIAAAAVKKMISR
jgi:hypothetical protein